MRVDQLKSALFSVLAESNIATERTEGVSKTASVAAVAVRDAIATTRPKFVGDITFDPSAFVRKSLEDMIKTNPGLIKTVADAVRPVNWGAIASVMPNPLFVKGQGDADAVSMNDIDQNKLGNCWMMAPMAALAAKDPQAIKNMIQDNHDGTYTVTFKEFNPFAGWIDKKITVTADFPGGINGSGHAGVGDKNIGGKGEIWPLIIEKAYAQYKGGYDKLEGGNAAEFLSAMTGRMPSTYAPMPLPFGGGMTADQLQNEFNAGKPIIFSTRDNGTLGYGLVNDHAYAVQNVYTDANGRKMVQLYNPWGNSHPSPIPYDDFINNFTRVTVGG